jgi:hypothetical protein
VELLPAAVALPELRLLRQLLPLPVATTALQPQSLWWPTLAVLLLVVLSLLLLLLLLTRQQLQLQPQWRRLCLVP